LKLALGPIGPAFEEAGGRLKREKAVDRIWDEDASLWKADEAAQKNIQSSLGWLTVAGRMADEADELMQFAGSLAEDADRALVMGMGGSSLAPLVFSESFPAVEGALPIEVLDSTDPEEIRRAASRHDPARTIYVVSSKSGTTLEPNLFFDAFYDMATASLGEKAGSRFLVITDPGSAMETEAAKRGVRRTFAGDPRIGGRYSALSAFGLVPAALMGVDLRALLSRAEKAAKACRAAFEDNPGARLGAALGAAALSGRDKVTFAVTPPIGRFGLWTEQLIAESTGKEGKGILPVEREDLADPSRYGSDRFFVSIARDDDAAFEPALAALEAAGNPRAALKISDAADLGAQMFLWEFATAVAGFLLGINPFDQPNVQEAKDLTNAVLASGKPPAGEGSAPGDERALSELLSSLGPGDYFAITAYIPSSEENERALQRIRLLVRDARKVATTIGFGPRFQHSTGQLHKGGPDTGVFLQVTAGERESLPIKGRPWGFKTVIDAQAAGDLQALRSRGRRALRVVLPRDHARGLADLEAAVASALRTAAR
jgi:glucose-6-phosphate isomerase